MNAAVNKKVMDWSKYSLDEWLKQYGAYIQLCRMRGGSDPNDLGINQIYWLICESIGEVKRKDQAICMIDDYEAEQVRKLIYDVKTSERICKSAKVAVSLFIENLDCPTSEDKTRMKPCKGWAQHVKKKVAA